MNSSFRQALLKHLHVTNKILFDTYHWALPLQSRRGTTRWLRCCGNICGWRPIPCSLAQTSKRRSVRQIRTLVNFRSYGIAVMESKHLKNGWYANTHAAMTEQGPGGNNKVHFVRVQGGCSYLRPSVQTIDAGATVDIPDADVAVSGATSRSKNVVFPWAPGQSLKHFCKRN